jgi:hypothetical protein
MLYTLSIACGGMIALLLGWTLVQAGWRRAFPDALTDDEDVLAGRRSCGNCGCSGTCTNRAIPNS